MKGKQVRNGASRSEDVSAAIIRAGKNGREQKKINVAKSIIYINKDAIYNGNKGKA